MRVLDAPVRPEEMAARAEEGAALLRALANPQRLRLVCELVGGERGVAELEELTGIRQPTLSKELGKLREAGLIEGRRQSKAVFYSLVDARAAAILGVLCERSPEPPSASRRKSPSAAPASRERGSVFARVLPPKP